MFENSSATVRPKVIAIITNTSRAALFGHNDVSSILALCFWFHIAPCFALYLEKFKFNYLLSGEKVIKHIMNNKEKHNILDGLTLQVILEELVAHYGFDELGGKINIRCFTHDPSIKSSLKFLRKTPWAREKVEKLFIQMKKNA